MVHEKRRLRVRQLQRKARAMITMKGARAQYADRKTLSEAVYERDEETGKKRLVAPRKRVRRGHHLSFRVWAREYLTGELSPKLDRIVRGAS